MEVVGCRVTVRGFVEVEALLRCGRGRLEGPASGEGGSAGSSYCSTLFVDIVDVAGSVLAQSLR